jgi:hypothetical protein
MKDELRQRLASLDPMHSGEPVTPVTSESARHMLEAIMSTSDQAARPRNRWVAIAGVAAAVVAVAAIGVGVARNGGDEASPTTVADAVPPLELTAGGENIMSSCIRFSVEQLAEAPLAFEGTVTAVDGPAISLQVDHWYKGGDAATVRLNAPQGMEALIGGMPFNVGDQYLISAYDGNVNYCGFSGPSTPELKAAFDEAFGE